MNEAARPSRIFQDLLNLEKDFKYNLTLLRIRDAEIERCSKTNAELQEALKSYLAVNGKLSARIAGAEDALRKSEGALAKEKQIHQEMVNRLTANLNETKHSHHLSIESHKKELKRREGELERACLETLRKKQMDCERSMEEVQARLQKEMLFVSKTKEQIQTLMDENMTLRNKIRELESQYISETSFYKSELKTIQSNNVNLNSETERLRGEIARSKTENAKLKAQNNERGTELREGLVHIENLVRQNKETERLKRKLNDDLLRCQRSNGELIANVDELAKERSRLGGEVAKLKIDTESNKVHCSIPEHNKCEELVKQNVVLREIVKSMRKERETFVKEDPIEIQNAEKRIEKLECIVELFKQNALVNRT